MDATDNTRTSYYGSSDDRTIRPRLAGSDRGNRNLSGHQKRNRRTQIQGIVATIEHMNQNHSLPFDPSTSKALIETLRKMSTPNTSTKDRHTLAQSLLTLPLISVHAKPSSSELAVLDRLIKATALLDFPDIARNITRVGFLQRDCLPGTIAQDALAYALRRTGNIETLTDFLTMSGKIMKQGFPGKLSTASFNMLLSALCEENTAHSQADSKSSEPRRKRKIIREEGLEQAWQWIATGQAKNELMIVPDSFSFATVLQAAAVCRNRTLADSVWNFMLQENVAPSIVAYNARLQILLQTSRSPDEEVLGLWENEILPDGGVTPDRYTIDWMLLPLIRSRSPREVMNLMDSFIAQNSQDVVSNAFAAFFVTLVNAGELTTAKSLFETYIAPTFSPVLHGNVGSLRMVKPQPRHFNILLDGYRQKLEHVGMHNSTTFLEHSSGKLLYLDAWELYRRMMKCSMIRPDPVTVTSMMSICRTSEELSNLIKQSITELDIKLRGAVFRAALTSYGSVGDPSSACWLFVACQNENHDLRAINVLIGSLAKAAHHDASHTINIRRSNASRKLGHSLTSFDETNAFVSILDSVSSVGAVLKILDALNSGQEVSGRTMPSPDSQTYCVAATAIQHGRVGEQIAMDLFYNASNAGVEADGRFVNALFRCFGDDIKAALAAWKDVIRPACIAYENRTRSWPIPKRRMRGKNMFAAYNGLLFVCGRAQRPDIAVRVAYAMRREGLDPNELSLNCYHSGKRSTGKSYKAVQLLAQKLNLVGPYEDLLYVECMKYDQNDRRRSGERRVRIIV